MPSLTQGPGRAGGQPGAESLIRILTLAYGLAVMLYLAWLMIPAHQRKLLMMRILSRTQRAAGRAAFRAGHQAMGLELRGHGANYSFPYALSVAAVAAGRYAEKLRYTA